MADRVSQIVVSIYTLDGRVDYRASDSVVIGPPIDTENGRRAQAQSRDYGRLMTRLIKERVRSQIGLSQEYIALSGDDRPTQSRILVSLLPELPAQELADD